MPPVQLGKRTGGEPTDYMEEKPPATTIVRDQVVLRDIADPRPSTRLSTAFGDYDRSMMSFSRGRGLKSSDSTSYSTHRQRVLSPGEIANLPPG